jgi:hypothetical protein
MAREFNHVLPAYLETVALVDPGAEKSLPDLTAPRP